MRDSDISELNDIINDLDEVVDRLRADIYRPEDAEVIFSISMDLLDVGNSILENTEAVSEVRSDPNTPPHPDELEFSSSDEKDLEDRVSRLEDLMENQIQEINQNIIRALEEDL